MSRNLSKRFAPVLKLLLLLGLPTFLVVAVLLVRPFNPLSRLAVLMSPYRKLLPYIVAQARHETTDFKSNILKTHNNFFGMKNANKREQLGERGDQAPDGGYYQRYALRLISVLDYLRYLRAVNFPTSVSSVEDFAIKLNDRNYFGVGGLATYTNGLKRYLS